jgi:hypothetical protein
MGSSAPMGMRTGEFSVRSLAVSEESDGEDKRAQQHALEKVVENATKLGANSNRPGKALKLIAHRDLDLNLMG